VASASSLSRDTDRKLATQLLYSYHEFVAWSIQEEDFVLLLLCSFDASQTLETQRSEKHSMPVIGVKALHFTRTAVFFKRTPSSDPAV